MDFNVLPQLTVFIGFDSREPVASAVAEHSLKKRASVSVRVAQIDQKTIRDTFRVYTRPKDEPASTEFAFSRFFVPFFMNYHGWAVFCDADFLWQDDIATLFETADPLNAVHVVQHDYTPKETWKMDGQPQIPYPRKNWSSLILWNCYHSSNRILDLDLLNHASGSYLHQFQWLDDEEIGSLHHRWNWLEGWYHEPDDGTPSVIHYTRGGPWFESWKNVDYANRWIAEFKETIADGELSRDVVFKTAPHLLAYL